jgi:hypothetical protein
MYGRMILSCIYMAIKTSITKSNIVSRRYFILNNRKEGLEVFIVKEIDAAVWPPIYSLLTQIIAFLVFYVAHVREITNYSWEIPIFNIAILCIAYNFVKWNGRGRIYLIDIVDVVTIISCTKN